MTEQTSDQTTAQPNWVDSPFVGGGHHGHCGICHQRTRKMGSESKALTAIDDHRRDAHPEAP